MVVVMQEGGWFGAATGSMTLAHRKTRDVSVVKNASMQPRYAPCTARKGCFFSSLDISMNEMHFNR
jgi:hypothetical protein